MEPVSAPERWFSTFFNNISNKSGTDSKAKKKNKLLSWLSLVTAFSTEKGFGAGAPPLLLEEEERKKKTRNKDEWSETK